MQLLWERLLPKPKSAFKKCPWWHLHAWKHVATDSHYCGNYQVRLYECGRCQVREEWSDGSDHHSIPDVLLNDIKRWLAHEISWPPPKPQAQTQPVSYAQAFVGMGYKADPHSTNVIAPDGTRLTWLQQAEILGEVARTPLPSKGRKTQA